MTDPADYDVDAVLALIAADQAAIPTTITLADLPDWERTEIVMVVLLRGYVDWLHQGVYFRFGEHPSDP